MRKLLLILSLALFRLNCIDDITLTSADHEFVITTRSDSIGGCYFKIEFEKKDNDKPEITVDYYTLNDSLVNNTYIWQFYTTYDSNIKMEIDYKGMKYNDWIYPLNTIHYFKCNDSNAIEIVDTCLNYVVSVPKKESYHLRFYTYYSYHNWFSLFDIELINDTNSLKYSNVEFLGNNYTIIDTIQSDTIKFSILTKEIEEVEVQREFKVIKKIGSETRKVVILSL